MSFQLTDEHEMIRLMAKEFARKELEPYAHQRDREKIFPYDAVKKMGELGLMGMMVPSEYSGSEAGTISYCLALEEIAYACPTTAATMSISNLATDPLLRFGNDEQKQKYLEPLARGETFGAFALTEPEAGSDLGRISTRAEAKGDCFILNGEKSFVLNGGHADTMIVLARTNREKAHRGLSVFIVEKGFPGLIVGPEEDFMGLKASNVTNLVLQNCRIPKENLLGKEGSGFKIAAIALDGGRIGVAAQAVGIARACLDEAVEHAKNRKQFGRLIGSFQAIQWMIADSATEIEAAKGLTFGAADLKDQGLPFTREASMAKLFASEMANRVAHRALQIHGGYGYIKEYKIERLYRDARLNTIYQGTSEVQRMIIARETLKT
jgi:alkylation response protein AidB-like acyl-CoA dehydrogenase